MRIFARLLISATAVSIASGCGEPRRLPAQAAVFGDTLSVYALTGTNISFPTALNTGALVVVRATGVFDFDIAFDINAEGKTVILPVATLAAAEAGVRRVGLQKVAGTFDALTSAPRTGYVYDSTFVVDIGEVLVIEAAAPCIYPYPALIYSKLVVDSLNMSERRIHFHAVTDPGCGFRSFLPGIPKN